MNKFLKIFISVCVIIIGVYSLIAGIKQIMGTPSHRSAVSYIDQIGPISQKTADIMNGISPLLNNPNASPQEVLSKVSEARQNLESLNKEAAAIQPPEKMGGLHDQFKQAMDKYVRAFSLTETGLQNNNDTQLSEAGSLLTDGANQMQFVSKEIVEMSKR